MFRCSPLPGKPGNQLDLPPAEMMCQSPVRFEFSVAEEFPKRNGTLKKLVFMDFFFFFRFGAGLLRGCGPIAATLLFWGCFGSLNLSTQNLASAKSFS